jgi:hypothetical protein
MKASSLDILGKATLPHAQAHAILKVMEIELASAQETLATKVDLLTTEAKLRAEIAALRAEMLGKFSETHRWILTCILGQTAVLAGVGYFFLAHFGR